MYIYEFMCVLDCLSLFPPVRLSLLVSYNLDAYSDVLVRRNYELMADDKLFVCIEIEIPLTSRFLYAVERRFREQRNLKTAKRV